MSNYGGCIDQQVAEQLRAAGGAAFARHAAWDFNGRVWFSPSGGLWCEEVWRYGVPLETLHAANLSELMRLVNERWGAG
jgi:hypothetical protein